MQTYQDLLAVRDTLTDRLDFIRRVINTHKTTELYRTAQIADEYDRGQNSTIMKYQRVLYQITGQPVIDTISPNYKLPSKIFNRFVTQEVQYLLGNGSTWEKAETADKLGKDFDRNLKRACKDALTGAVSFGFWNLDHLEVFSVLQFAPLYDEETGALRAGVRFWQIDNSKPLRATLYEEDGYTEFIWEHGRGSILRDKAPYIINYVQIGDETTIFDGENYPTFPIVPLWGNPHRQSEIIGIRQGIDCYDLVKSGFANNIDDANEIFWILQNAGGMDDIDIAKFRDRLHRVKAAVVEDDGAKAEAHTLEVPYQARETLLTRMEKDLYKDFMALDTDHIASGATTATQIKAGYEPMDNKVDQFEDCVKDFVEDILILAGVDDTPTYTRSKIVNTQEEIQTVLQAAEYLPDDYVTKKILDLLGDSDKAEEVINQLHADEINRTIPEQKETGDFGDENGEQV